MIEARCEQCAEPTAAYDAIRYGSMETGHRLLCTQCFNAEVARRYGTTDLENVRPDPIDMVDSAGDSHRFHFQMRLLGPTMIVLDAFEVREDVRCGYEFRIMGAPDDDVLTLLGRLVEKMRRALSVRFLCAENHRLRISDQTVQGRISSDMAGFENMPVVVVDGKEIMWDDFGRMLMAFEGWQFRLDIADPADEL
ncbi:hypothetical protein PTKU46_95770 [Paraburkholderia terrae]|uniref:DUF7713 domain-containing protein n=1 Tax=Paraburkholderia terrae TaxID=311230 RepID=UPI0030E1B16F